MHSTFVRSYADLDSLPTKGLPQVAFLGRSNVGKSSLINSLTKSKNLARTSSNPGQTKLINFFDVDGEFHLVDLPGYGFAKVSKQARENLFELIEGFLNTSALLRLVIVIIDSRIGPTKDDLELIEYLQDSFIPFFLVANKVDKLSRTELTKNIAKIRADFSGIEVFPHSSTTAAGRNELYQAILQHLSQPDTRFRS